MLMAEPSSHHRAENAKQSLENNAFIPIDGPALGDGDVQKHDKLSISKRIFQAASPQERILYLVGILCSIGSGTILPLMTLIFGNFVSIFTAFSTGTLDPRNFRAEIDHYTLYFVYLFIAKLGLSYISQILFAIVATRVSARLRQSYLKSILHRSITFHEIQYSSGAVSLALSSHCNAVQSGLSDKFSLSVQNISTVVSAFVVAFVSQWKLTLVTATIIPATVIGIGVTAVFDSKLEESLNATNADAATSAEEILGSIRTVLALRATEKLLSKYKSYLNHAVSLGRKHAPILGVQTAIYMFMVYAAYALAIWYGIHLFANEEVRTSGQVITTLFSIIIGTNSFSQLAGYIGGFLRIFTAGAELLRVIEDQSLNTSSSSEETVSGKSVDSTGDIIFSTVGFQYPLRPGVQVLQNFSLTLPAGKMTALIGPSGSGKSTVIGLIERFYDVAQEDIFVGQQNLNNIPIQHLRGQIGLVQQEPVLFNATILENVLFGLPNDILEAMPETERKDRVQSACKLANADEFIQTLPKGYDSFVGNKATMLSGGQKQRLAIARAVINDPPILILDEATSALDPASEREVQHALDRASKNRTTIAIAHRLSTIRNADSIVVMNHGTIVEQGTHDELLSRDHSVYSHLLEAQSMSQPESSSLPIHYLTDIAPIKESEKPASIFQSNPATDYVQDDATRLGLFKTISSALYDQRRHWLAFIILFICCIIGGALFPMQAYFYSQVVTAFQSTGSELISKGDFWALMFFILSLVVGAAYFAIAGVGECLGESAAQSYRFAYIGSMVKQPVSFFDEKANSSGSLTSRLSTEPDATKSLAGPNLGVITVVATSLLSTIILSLAVGWKLGLVAIFGALPFIFFAGLVHETMEHRVEDIVKETFSGSVGFATECIQAIRTVKALNMQSRIEDHYKVLLKDHCEKAQNHALKSMFWFALCESIDLLCMGLTFWYGGTLLASHEYNTTQFFIVFVAIVLGSQSAGQFLAYSLDIATGSTAYHEIRSLAFSEVRDTVLNETVASESSSSECPLIEFNNACFSYPTRSSQPVLRNLNLKLEKGQFIALVGPSGCGKSTILGLLERFYDLNGGQLLLNDRNISAIPRDEVRGKLSLVSQEPTLYQGTIRENILLGTEKDLSDAELDVIAKQAQIFDLILSLPEGYNTQVGSRGTALSGGQKQILAMARAIAMNKEILLLDEATSALDCESEGLVQEALKQAGKNRSIIAIAHRLSTIQHADVIYVLKDGRVGESGTHQGLLKLRGLYFQMCQSQGMS